MKKQFVIFVMIVVLVACGSIDHNEVDKEETTTVSTTQRVPLPEEDELVVLTEKDVSFDRQTGTILRYLGSETNIRIPDRMEDVLVTAIGSYAFSSRGIQRVVLPGSLIEIQESAFSSNQLTGELIIPASVVSIEDFAFHGTIEGRFNQIGTLTFASGSSLRSIGTSAFAHNNLTTLDLPEGVTTIGETAFASNLLSSFYLPSTIEVLKPGAFNWNRMSGSNVFVYHHDQNGVNDTIVSGYAGPRNGVNLTIPDQVEEIAVAAFSHGFFSGTLTIPKHVRIIGAHAFAMNSFQEIVFHEDSQLESMKTQSLSGSTATTIVLPKKLKTILSGALPSSIHKIVNLSNLTLGDMVRQKVISSGMCEHMEGTDPKLREGQFQICSQVIEVVTSIVDGE